MNRPMAMLLTALLLTIAPLAAQWVKVDSIDAGATGKLAVHNGNLFLYGDPSGPQVFRRSTDNGLTWTDLAASLPDELFHLHSHNGELLANIGGTTVNGIFASSDDGATWTLRGYPAPSTGAILTLVSDGTALYAVGNRASVFRSLDNGATWTEFTIPDTFGPVNLLDFAAIGDTWVATATGLGALVSMDGGSSWQTLNPAFIIGGAEAINGTLFGTTFGVYELDGAPQWNPRVNGWPGFDPFYATGKSLTAAGTTVFAYAATIFEGAVYMSGNGGAQWSAVGTGLPTDLATGLDQFLAANADYVFCYLWGAPSSHPDLTGIYRTGYGATAIAGEGGGALPAGFALEQNYPNPFNPSTAIAFHIERASPVRLAVYDPGGRRVAVLVEQTLGAGRYSVRWDGRDASGRRVASGTYLYRLEAGSRKLSRKMLLVR